MTISVNIPVTLLVRCRKTAIGKQCACIGKKDLSERGPCMSMHMSCARLCTPRPLAYHTAALPVYQSAVLLKIGGPDAR